MRTLELDYIDVKVEDHPVDPYLWHYNDYSYSNGITSAEMKDVALKKEDNLIESSSPSNYLNVFNLASHQITHTEEKKIQ